MRTHLDAFDGRLFRVDDDRVHVAAEDDADGRFVLAVRRLTEVEESALDAGKDPLERLQSLALASLFLRFALGGIRLRKLPETVFELFGLLRLELPACVSARSATGRG